MAKGSKPKVLIVADRGFWAYHLIQKFISTYLSEDYDIYTDFILFHPLSSSTAMKHKLARWVSYAKLWPHRRILHKKHKYDITIHLGYYYSRTSAIKSNTSFFIRGIFTDGFPPQGIDNTDIHLNIEQFTKKYFSDTDAVVCGSQSIYDTYQGHIENLHFANLSWEKYFQRLSPKQKNSRNRFVIGWTGNPKRGFKGFNDYIVPAFEAAKKLRPGIVLKTRFSGPIKTLPGFYQEVDVVLIASIADAGPSLFSEAAFAEVPSISTRVGHPVSIIEDGVNGILIDRDVTEMRNAIIRLYDDRELLFSMSKRIRIDTARVLGIEQMRKAWKDLFNSVL